MNTQRVEHALLDHDEAWSVSDMGGYRQKAAGGKDTMYEPPAVVNEDRELGRRYVVATDLAGRYS